MSLVGTLAIRLLESELFLLTFIEKRADKRIVVGRSSTTLPTISILARNVIGSTGNQLAACMARSTSSLLPTSPTLSASPGIPLLARITIGRDARPGSCS